MCWRPTPWSVCFIEVVPCMLLLLLLLFLSLKWLQQHFDSNTLIILSLQGYWDSSFQLLLLKLCSGCKAQNNYSSSTQEELGKQTFCISPIKTRRNNTHIWYIVYAIFFTTFKIAWQFTKWSASVISPSSSALQMMSRNFLIPLPIFSSASQNFFSDVLQWYKRELRVCLGPFLSYVLLIFYTLQIYLEDYIL